MLIIKDVMFPKTSMNEKKYIVTFHLLNVCQYLDTELTDGSQSK